MVRLGFGASRVFRKDEANDYDECRKPGLPFRLLADRHLGTREQVAQQVDVAFANRRVQLLHLSMALAFGVNISGIVAKNLVEFLVLPSELDHSGIFDDQSH